MSIKDNLAEIKHALWKACEALRGVSDTDFYMEYVLTLLFWRLISNKNNSVANHHAFQANLNQGKSSKNSEFKKIIVPESANFWIFFKNINDFNDVGIEIDSALSRIEAANFELEGVFQAITFNNVRLGNAPQRNAVLRRLLDCFAVDAFDMLIVQPGSDPIIGEIYEDMIAKFAVDMGKKAVAFYTPGEISDLLAKLLEPKAGDAIYDPACGSGSMLIKCARQIQEATGKRDYVLFGQEKNGSTWALAKMNMIMHGEKKFEIAWGDTLLTPKILDQNDKLKQFDVIISHPPFSVETWPINEAMNDRHDRFRWGIPPKNKGDYAFISHMLRSLKPKTGRMGVIVPHGVLFRGGTEREIRKHLIEENLLDAVIGLPSKLFFGTSIPAAIMLFRNDKTDKKITFIDASLSFIANKNQNQLGPKNVNKIVDTYKGRLEIVKFSRTLSREEIENNDYNLNIPRYIDTSEAEPEIDLAAVQGERLCVQAKLNATNKKIEEFIEKMGFGLN